MKFLNIRNSWSDMGLITGMAIVGTILWHWSYCIILIWSIIVTMLMKNKQKKDALVGEDEK